jgi:hypothetical protein
MFKYFAFTAPLALASCSSSDPPAPCSTSLQEFTECPANFDGTLAQLPPCMKPNFLPMSIRLCADIVVLTFEGGYSAVDCCYDASSHELVGGLRATDTTAYCDSKSFNIAAGRTAAPSCRQMAPTETKSCSGPDGGP